MYRKETLPNGVRVLTEEIPSVHSAAVGIWIGCGSRDETEQQLGVSHFLEHMFFKGTSQRSAKQIAEELDAVGGQLNAFTTKEYTCLYAKVLSEDLDLAIDVLSDMFFNSIFDQKEMEKEKKVVLEEIKMYEDSPDELVHDLFSETVWPEHPLGKPILGTVQSIEDLTRQQLMDYYHSRYAPQRIVLAVAGNISHQQTVHRLNKTFGSFKRNGVSRTLTQAKYRARGVSKNKDTEQLQVCLGVPGFAQDDADIYALYMLNNLLGGGLSSRLFQEIREERGLAYSVYSYHNTYLDTGLFTIYAGTSPKNYQQLIDVILNEIYQIKSQGISAEELKRTKAQIKGSLLLSQENVSSRMSRLGKTELCYDRVVTAEEIVKAVNKVSLDDISRVAQTLFQRDLFATAAIGNLDVDATWPKLMAKTQM